MTVLYANTINPTTANMDAVMKIEGMINKTVLRLQTDSASNVVMWDRFTYRKRRIIHTDLCE